MQRQQYSIGAGSSQGYGSYGTAGVSHLPTGYTQPLGAGRPREQHVHLQHHSPSPSRHPGQHNLGVGAPVGAHSSLHHYAAGHRGPSPAPSGHMQQMSTSAVPQPIQYAPHQPQSSFGAAYSTQSASHVVTQEAGHRYENMHSQSSHGPHGQGHGHRSLPEFVPSMQQQKMPPYEPSQMPQQTSAATASSHASVSRHSMAAEQQQQPVYQHSMPASMPASQLYDPQCRELHTLNSQSLGTSVYESRGGDRRLEQVALSSRDFVDRMEGGRGHQPMRQQQQSTPCSQAIPNAPTQVSNSMSIRELASLVSHLPPHADPFPLIHDTLRAMSDEPTAHTTLMIRNIPTKYTQRLFLREIKQQGFDKCIDFLYLPSDSRGKGNVGYGFINFVTTGFLSEFKKDFSESKFRQYAAQQPLTIIMSTTQGWKENLVKVIRNCVLKRQIAPEFLPLLFCRSTGQEYPFPIPSHATPNCSPPGSPHVSDNGFFLGSNSMSNLNLDSADAESNLMHFENNNTTFPRVGSLSANRSAHDRSRSVSLTGSENHSCRGRSESANTALSWESQCRAVETDPLNAFAPNADGPDAIGLTQLRNAHAVELSARAPSFSYMGNNNFATGVATASTGGFKLGNADVAAFVPSGQVGRYQIQSSAGCQHASEAAHTYESASVGVASENSWNDSILAKPTGIQKCKAQDFFKHHGLNSKTDHLEHVELRKKDVSCTVHEKAGTIQMPRFPITNPSGKSKGKGKGGCVYFDMAQNAKGKGKGKTTISARPNAVASRAASAITSTVVPEVPSPIRSQSAKEFCDIDVFDFHMSKLKTVMDQAQSDTDQDSAFNAAVFTSQPHLAHDDDLAPSIITTPVLNRMWSDASVAMTQMVKGIRAGHGDVNVASESYDSNSESERIPLFARIAAAGTPDLMSLAGTPVRFTTPADDVQSAKSNDKNDDNN